MKKFLAFVIFCVFFATPVFALENDSSITILAPKNMSYAMTEIIRSYSKKNNITVTASYNIMTKHSSDIEEGFPADIIVTNHPEWIRLLKQKGVINVTSISNLVEDKLVLVVNRSFYNLHQESFVKLDKAYKKRRFYKNFPVILADRSTDLTGNYSYEALFSAPFLKYRTGKVIESQNILEELSKISDAMAIVKYSDIYDNSDVSIVESFDEDSYPRFIYQAAIIAGAQAEYSAKFVDYLVSEKSLGVLKKYGFELLK
jgi:molybdate transport system substrate-binding protein